MTLLLALAGCGSNALPPLAPPPVDRALVVTEKRVAEGTPVVVEVRTWAEPGWTVPPVAPTAEGLTATRTATDGPTREGERDRLVETWELTGAPGSYVVSVGEVEAADAAGSTRALAPPPVFVDVGVDGPLAQGISDFEAPPPPPPPRYGAYAAIAGGTLLVAGLGVGLAWWRRRRPEPVVQAEPPHQRALRRWEEARAGDLDDHSLALALSAILREYIEDTQAWPATARTTREILQYVASTGVLGVADRLRARRVLDATDRLKFAREGGGAAFFDELDADFRAVVSALRPSLGGPGAAG
jgi:predicted nucleic acid-binding protein